jgi:putative acetyltransferase
MKIRQEKPNDRQAVYQINAAAFGRHDEADLVDALRSADVPVISLVAEAEGEIIGHALFTQVSIPGWESAAFMALGPIAVLPGWQQQGVGSALVEAGLDACRTRGCTAVFVLGHPTYYPRFGFVPSTRFGIDSEFGVPEEVFMAQELVDGALEGVSGTVHYHPVLKGV